MKYKALILLLVVVVAALVWFVWNGVYEQMNGGTLPGAPTVYKEFNSVTGSVKEVRTGSILIEMDENPLNIPAREAFIKGNTHIVRIMEKSQKTFDAEMAQFLKAVAVNNTLPAPSRQTEKEITLKEMKVGDLVTADSFNNIGEKTSFEASYIRVTTPLAR